jgi:hypothetical protein
MKRRVSAGVAVLSATCMLFACSFGRRDDYEEDDNEFRADVIECEDALARLQRCCPDFDAKPVLCKFFYSKSSGCGSIATSNVEPAFSTAESACIRNMSCDELVDKKVCARGQKARAYTTNTTTPYPPSTTSSSGTVASSTARPTVERESHPPVCP